MTPQVKRIVLEAQIIKETGWTITELDEQPFDRVMDIYHVWNLQAEYEAQQIEKK